MITKRDKTDFKEMFERWALTIHNDLRTLHLDGEKKTVSKKDKNTYNQLKGLRDSILLEACSGVGYIYQGKFYKNIDELESCIDDPEEDIEVDRVMSIDYLLHFIDGILNSND